MKSAVPYAKDQACIRKLSLILSNELVSGSLHPLETRVLTPLECGCVSVHVLLTPRVPQHGPDALQIPCYY